MKEDKSDKEGKEEETVKKAESAKKVEPAKKEESAKKVEPAKKEESAKKIEPAKQEESAKEEKVNVHVMHYSSIHEGRMSASSDILYVYGTLWTK